jgi:hypothetical protein
MNQKTARAMGIDSGLEAGRMGDFNEAELKDVDAFLYAGYEICSNKTQYAGHPFELIAEEPVERRDGLYDAFEEGENVGLRKAWRERQKRKKIHRQEIAEILRNAKQTANGKRRTSKTNPLHCNRSKNRVNETA